MMVQICAVLLSAAAAIIGGLVLMNLKTLKDCIVKQDNEVKQMREAITTHREALSACQVKCRSEFVSSELFLRETGFTRRSMEHLTASVNRMEGQLTIADKLPAICGDIARSIIAEVNNGAKHE